MAKDEAYRRAEEKIEAALRSEAKELDLSAGRDSKYSEKLTELPRALSKLTHLVELNLFGNHLTALPEWIGQLTQLQSLDLSGNKLTSLPESL